MPGLSRSVITAQRGRSYSGEPSYETDAPVTVLYPQPPENVYPFPVDKAARRRMSIRDREAGMATAEYAIATLAAVAFAALLVAVLGSGEVRTLLMGLIRSALTLG
ncbi:DUF4244 domain-containing protein [Arthrobacter gengyunqii]|uniref:DUF4244 domain-containing protein n=1 Tax=Arthrobacter gengyunqii TaxID=2886940 RepID=A0ABS8GH60_9MICC|nr:DUF4244 domain-containing protein [Arthrobacter gengyunqii]MCC3265678.1 DUF4244 domain-containing protein [Arthrobacter gengyunqii]